MNAAELLSEVIAEIPLDALGARVALSCLAVMMERQRTVLTELAARIRDEVDSESHLAIRLDSEFGAAIGHALRPIDVPRPALKVVP